MQQAQAKIDARNLIVQGSVAIVNETMNSLDQKGLELSPEARSDLVKKLMVITCSDHGQTHNVINV